MGYVLSEEQQLLKDSARDLFRKAPVALVRDLRDNGDERGYSAGLWDQMVEMGWPGLIIEEKFGGLDFGFRSLGILMQESGRTLSASPLLSLAVSASVLQKYASETQKSLLTSICTEGLVMSLAIQEGEFFDPDNPAVQGEKQDGDYVLNGTKDLVSDAHIADRILVSARTGEGITMFLLDVSAEGVGIEKEFMMDSRYYSRLSFHNVRVSPAQIIGKENGGKKVLFDIINTANALLSAELIGVMSEAFERTVEYLKERRQFDKAIGTFQGLQHRAADLYGEIEIAKSITIKALDALDEEDFMAPALCSMAKAKCIRVSQIATNEGIQMFGGIGMTDDEEIGFFLKRARVAAQLFGGYSYHLDRFARMSGY